MKPLTLVELANVSADYAVTSRFDEDNFRKARWVGAFFAIVAAGASIGVAIEDPRRLVVLLPTLAYFLVFTFALRRHHLGRGPAEGRDAFLEPVRRSLVAHPRASVVVLLIVIPLALILAALGSDGLLPLVMMTAFFVIPFRLRPSERFLVHGAVAMSLLLGLLAGLPISEKSEDAQGTVGGVIVNHAFALGIGLLTTRRVRREILAGFASAQANAREQLRMRQELDYAREIQLAMLPADCPPQGWLDICSYSNPATEVGGDYYDYFPLAGGRLAVVVGDVAGHGMASGLLLAGVRSCLTILAAELDDPLAVLGKLDGMVRQTARRRMLVTLAIVVLDPAKRKATIANAGHPPILLARASGVEEISIPSIPLGTQLAPRFGVNEVEIETGDVLLLHSDGLYEGEDPRGEPYGLDRLAASLARVPRDGAATATRDAILADFESFQNDAPQRDDLTFLVVKVGASEAEAAPTVCRPN